MSRHWFQRGLFAACIVLSASPAIAAPRCQDEQPTPQTPSDAALCARLDPIVRRPSALRLDQYEIALNDYVSAMCHRNTAGGWQRDKTVRDTGPFTATLADGKWTGSYAGTHQPVLVWYSPEMLAWMKVNRPTDPAKTPAHPAPIPDGAIMVKEMYSPPPAASCRIDDPLRLRPDTEGMAVMVRDRAAALDGWFWSAIGWKGWTPDWPPPPSNAPALSGFGQYCTNCHASARDNQTFASLGNVAGEPGTFLSFLSQDFFVQRPEQLRPKITSVSPHQIARLEAARRPPPTPPALTAGLLQALGVAEPPVSVLPEPLWMPSQSYDHTWVRGTGAGSGAAFLTSDQCVGCHSAGGTGLQFDMTLPQADNLMLNLSPYGTWRSSPKGLAGRDPIFFAQLASETQSFHPQSSSKVQDACLGCHGILGQRQAAIDTPAGQACPDFQRETVNAVPFPDANPNAAFGALARDGVSCLACHRMVLNDTDTRRFRDAPQNRCVAERQNLLNPGTSGIARTFTGSFLVGATDQIAGPYGDPKQVPMRHALGNDPVHRADITSPELCGTCHTVHLPVLQDGRTVGHTYEQTTYPEWAFSA